MIVINQYRFGSVAYDSDAQTYFTASGLSNSTIKDAVNAWIVGKKADSQWTNLKGAYFFAGGTQAIDIVNAKTPGTFNLTSPAHPTYSTNGVTGNGSSQYLSTGIIPATHISSVNAATISFYCRTNNAVDGYDFGAVNDATGYNKELALCLRWSDNVTYLAANNIEDTTSAVTDTRGFFTLTRTASNSYSLYRNGTLVQAFTSASTSLHTVALTILAMNADSGPLYYCNRQCAGFEVYNEAFDATKALNSYNRWQTFNTALSRAV